MADITGMLQAAAGVGGGGIPWDISTAVYNGTPFGRFVVQQQDTNPAELFFKPDGTKMYITGQSSDSVHEYNLSSAWDINTASYLQSFSVAGQETTPTGLFFKPDGTKMYITGVTTNDAVYEYDLSSAWDISSASYLQNFSVAGQDTLPNGVFFKPDGTKMYVAGNAGDDINEYDLSSAWDISTASYLQNFSVAAQETTPSDVFFKPDGTKMYITGQSSDSVNEYDLSSAWDISTASYLQNFSVAGQETNPSGVFFKPDGTEMYVVGGLDQVHQYSLSSAWDVSTASYDFPPTTNYLSVVSQETNPSGLFFKPDGTKMYVIGTAGDDVNEYDLSSAWDISSASYLQNFSVAGQDADPQSLFFKPDGTKMYVLGSQGDDVNEYDLSSAWNISTASYLQNFSVVSQDTSPLGLFFKPDGTKMYVVGTSSDSVNEYDLSSAWDISTASYLQAFSVASQASTPTGLFFKDDGTKMYVVDTSTEAVYEYDLSSAWNISTASYLQSYSVASKVFNPSDIFFKPDGTVMYVVDIGFINILSYDL